ncbi:HNH endonuclease [Dyadobacter sp. Leaf189]|uniref:HNH endonuclease n=1 Tax=Dyadobacter sp. Leaf189 TaxID=1736295 RepID=UPI0006FAD088|nr:HNH endonuclease [Dyadobacter sp. Leaf189]KQS34101.1 hypothetical protein ASG33_08800 [Dyadobacter sp. Leaf189]
MISIEKDFKNPPQSLATSLTRTSHILDALSRKNKHPFNSKLYRDLTISSLIELYHSKCGYCETDTSAGAPMQVEHYRPKAKVLEDIKHQGYYWLAYEWSNLILSCSKCNNKKRNRFPISGQRISTPGILNMGMPSEEFVLANSKNFLAENPQLLHPEIDKVEDQFLFNHNGEIVGLNERAQQTIIVCDLNRDELIFKRYSLLQEYRTDIKEILSEYLLKHITLDQCRYSLKGIFRRLAQLQLVSKQYSRFGYFMFYKFDVYIANSFEDKQKHAVKKLFELFKAGSL